LAEEKEILELLFEKGARDKAFERMLDQYQKPIYFYIRRMVLDHDDADDVCQNTFIKAWKGLDQFRGDSKVSTWLYRIAYHESITFLEKAKKIAGVRMEDVKSGLPTALQRDELFDGDDIDARLQAAVAVLPEKQKAVFVMKYYEEKKYEEIAEITGTSVGALKASFHHAVTKIEDFIKTSNTW
jgi:RNA polymerase sigma-70 factor (ECF subfamily)